MFFKAARLFALYFESIRRLVPQGGGLLPKKDFFLFKGLYSLLWIKLQASSDL